MEKLENFARSRGMLVFFPQPPKDSVKKHFVGKQTKQNVLLLLALLGPFFVLTMLTRIILRVTWIEARFAQ